MSDKLPTGAEIDRMYQTLSTYHQAFHDQCLVEDSYYRREFPVECDAAATPIKLPIAKTAIDDAAAQVDTTSINIYVPAATSTYKGDVKANKRRRYLIGSWHLCRTYNGLVLHHCVKHSFLYGMGVLKLMADPDAPFVMPVEAINPQTFYPDPAKRYVIEAYQRKGLDVTAEFESYYPNEGDEDTTLPLPGGDTEELWVEYWDEKYCVYRFGGRTVLRMEHNYGFLPYFWGDAGLGMKDRDNKAEYLYVGLLNPVHSLLEAQSRLMTQGEAISKQYAWPELDFVAETVERAKKIIAEWELGPGRHHALDRSVDVKRITPTSTPPEILTLMGIVGSFVENATVPGIVRGERPQGASSGYMTAVLAGLARVKFGGVVALIESLIQQVNVGYLKLVENVFEEVTVWGRTRSGGEEIADKIKKSDIAGNYVNFVDVTAVPPEEQERTLMVGSRLRQAKQISRRYFVTNYLKPTDVEAEIEQEYLDTFMESPAGMQLIANMAMQNYQAAEMLGNVGADQAANMIRGATGAAVPPMGGEYTQQDQAYGRPQQAGSTDELAGIAKTIGAQGVLPHVANARRAVIDQIKRRNQG